MKIIIYDNNDAIGSVLAKQFEDNGHDVSVIEFDYISEIDVSAFPDNVDVCYYLAWNSENRQNIEAQLANVTDVASVMTQAVLHGCKKFIGLGSWEEYGSLSGTVSEQSVPAPNTPYGIAKYAAGMYCMSESEGVDMECIWARVFDYYGPHSKGVISCLIKTALVGIQSHMPNGEQMWNCLYESDVAKILYYLGVKSVAPGIYNVADDKPRKLSEYVDLTIKALRRDGFNALKPEFDDMSKRPVNMNTSAKKVYAATGYKPEMSFIRGVHETIGKISERKD